MRTTQTVLFSLVVAMVFVIVLFADLLPLPLGDYASQRFLLVGFLALGCSSAVAVWVSRNGWQGFKRAWSVLLVAAGYIMLAVPFGTNPHAWVEPGMYAAFFSGFVFVGNLAADDTQKHRWVVILVYTGAISAALYGAVTLMVYLFALLDQVTDLSTFIPWGFVNIRYWSHVATWLIPLLALASLVGPFQKQRLWQFCCAMGATLWWWVVLLSSARGTMLGLAFGALVAVSCVGRPALPWLKVFLRYLAYGVVAWLLLSVLVPALLLNEASLRNLHAGSAGRLPMFIEAWRMSLENFPLGLGPQSWLTHDILTEDYLRRSKPGHPHNMYLMWAAEYGWLMMAAILVLAGQAIRLFWQRRAEVRAQSSGEQALPLAAFTASVSAALLHAGVSAVFMAPGSMLIGFLVLTVFWALISPNTQAAPRKSKGRALAAIVAGVTLGILACFWLREVTVYYHAMVEDRDHHFDSVPYGTPPRFWYYGNFPRHPSQMP
ncbi:O-antigen ligase family protein [Marinobacter sp. OP 3.4]|uniref:O-antigen ligase family protein n=1 Tax=Marinobacter sp. OP 3.4 TaxID=3076501 RepID=UPI002E244E73